MASSPVPPGTPRSNSGDGAGRGPVLTRQGSRTVVSNPLVTSGQALCEPTATEAAGMLIGSNALQEIDALKSRAESLASNVYSGFNSRAVVDYSVQWPEFVVPSTQSLVQPDVFPVHVYLSSLKRQEEDEADAYRMITRVGWLRVKHDDGPLLRCRVELHGSMLLVHRSPDAVVDADNETKAGEGKGKSEGGGDAPAAARDRADGDSGVDSDSDSSDGDTDGLSQVSLNSVTNFRPASLDLAGDEAVEKAKAAGATGSVFAVEAVTPRGTWVFALGLPGPEDEAIITEQADAVKRREQALRDAEAAPEVASKKKLKALKRAASRRAKPRAVKPVGGAMSSPDEAANIPPDLLMAHQFSQWIEAIAKQVPKDSLNGAIRRITTAQRAISGMDDIKKVTIACRADETVASIVSAVLDKLSHMNRQQHRTHGTFVLKATGRRDYAITKTRRLLQLEYVQECLRDNHDVEFSLVRNVAQPLRRLSVRASVVQQQTNAAELAATLSAMTGLKAGPDAIEEEGDSDSSDSSDEADGADAGANAEPNEDGASPVVSNTTEASAGAPVTAMEGEPPASNEAKDKPSATEDTPSAAAAVPPGGDSADAANVGDGDGADGGSAAEEGVASSPGASSTADATADPTTEPPPGGEDGSEAPRAEQNETPTAADPTPAKPLTRLQRLKKLRERRASLAASVRLNASANKAGGSGGEAGRAASPLPSTAASAGAGAGVGAGKGGVGAVSSPRGRRGSSLSPRPSSVASTGSATKPVAVEEPIPENALHMDYVRWPFRVSVLSVDNVKPLAHRIAIEHGEEIISTEKLPIKQLSVQVQLWFSGGLLPGCDMETRTIPFNRSARWMPPERLQTDLNLRDIPPDSRIVFVLRGVWPEAVEPERIACVAVPLTDYRRMLVMGTMSLKLWPNVVDVEHVPPAENTVHASPPVLHVMFDTFLHPISSPLFLADAVAMRSDEKEPPIEKLGWMHKLGKAGRLTKWKRRWFVLSERTSTLTYFASNLDEKPKGVVELFDFTVSTADELNQNYQKIVGSTRKTLNTYCFKLTKKNARTFYIYTESKHDRREWMDNIARVISSDTASEKSKAAAAEKSKTKGGFGSFFRRRRSSVSNGVDSEANKHSSETAASKLDSGQVDASSWVSAISDLIADDLPLPMGAARSMSALTDVAEEALDTATAEADAEFIAASASRGADTAAGEDDAGVTAAGGDGAGEGAGAAGAGAGGPSDTAENDEDIDAGSSGVHPTRWGPAIRFATCVNDPGLVYGFALAMARMHSEENIMFWLEAEMFSLRCAPSFPGSRLIDQSRLDEATRIFREYVSKDADIGDLMSGANAEKIRRRSSVSAFAAEDMTVGLPGGCMDAIVVALKAAHGKESAVPPTLFVDAQREIGLSVRDGFRSLVSKKSLEDCLGFQPQAPCVMSIFDTNVSGEPGVASLSAWYRTMCRLKGAKGVTALQAAMKAGSGIDPEYAAQCVVELNYSSSVGNFISTQAGTGRTPRGLFKPKTLDAAARADIYAKLWPASNRKLSGSLKNLLSKAGRLQGFLEKRWFTYLDAVPMESGGLQAFVSKVGPASPLVHSPSVRMPMGRATSFMTRKSVASARRASMVRAASRFAPVRAASERPRSGSSSSTGSQPQDNKRRSSRISRMMRMGSIRGTEMKVEEDEEDIIDAKTMSTLNKTFSQDPLFEPDAMVRALIWKCRRSITGRPEAMPKFLKSVTWCRNQQVREAHRLVATWAKLQRPIEALELLDERFGDAFVRQFAVDELRKLSDNELVFVLPQLVQALKYEVHHLSALALFLLERGLRQPTLIGLPLFWAFKVEIGCKPEVRLRYQTLLDAMTSNSTPRQRALLETQERLWSQEGVFAEVCQLVKSSKKLGKAKMKEVYRKKLHEVNEILPPTFVLPIDPRIEARRVIPEECKFMSSAKLPLWLVFENADPDGDKIMVMFKAGDDLRQDTVTLQLIRVMDNLWRQGGMDLRLSPYRCVSTWHDGGMLEIVRNAATTAEIQKTYGGKFGAYKDSTFDDWIRDNNPKQAAYKRAVDIFMVSAAGYVVATYLMGIGDRHNDNIMVKKSGHYFHIDFGHFLGNFKYAGFIKRERSRFVFTPEMAYVMGGSKAAKFKEFEKLCIKALNHLRRHGTNLINLFTLVVPAGMPELSSKEDINYLRDMLGLNMTDDEIAERFRADMNEALSNKFKRFDNTMHILKHG